MRCILLNICVWGGDGVCKYKNNLNVRNNEFGQNKLNAPSKSVNECRYLSFDEVIKA